MTPRPPSRDPHRRIDMGQVFDLSLIDMSLADLVIFQTQADLDPATVAQLTQEVQGSLPGGASAIVLAGGVSLSALSDDQLLDLGLRRVEQDEEGRPLSPG